MCVVLELRALYLLGRRSFVVIFNIQSHHVLIKQVKISTLSNQKSGCQELFLKKLIALPSNYKEFERTVPTEQFNSKQPLLIASKQQEQKLQTQSLSMQTTSVRPENLGQSDQEGAKSPSAVLNLAQL
jgi:hypothetical protein